MPHQSRRPIQTRPELRASDEEREQVVAQLREHYGTGRLTEDELSARIDHAYAARTHAELDVLTHDLPAPPSTVPVPTANAKVDRVVTPAGRALRTSFHIHLVVYIVVNLALIGIWALTDTHYFWPIWPILGWGVGLGANYWRAFLHKPISDDEIRRELEKGR